MVRNRLPAQVVKNHPKCMLYDEFSNTTLSKTPAESLPIHQVCHRSHAAQFTSSKISFLAKNEQRVTDVNTRGPISGITCAFSMNVFRATAPGTNVSINIPFSSRRKGQSGKDHSSFQVRLERNCWPRPGVQCPEQQEVEERT